MALTLAEASKLSNDILLQGVVETIVKDSPILQRLPFVEIVGNGLTYNQSYPLEPRCRILELERQPLYTLGKHIVLLVACQVVLVVLTVQSRS